MTISFLTIILGDAVPGILIYRDVYPVAALVIIVGLARLTWRRTGIGISDLGDIPIVKCSKPRNGVSGHGIFWHKQRKSPRFRWKRVRAAHPGSFHVNAHSSNLQGG